MLKSRPLFLLVITLCLLMVVVASYWIALMPQRVLLNLQADMRATSGTVLDVKLARLDIVNGFGVILEDVSMSNSDASAWQLTAKSIAVPGMLGGNIVVEQAVLDVDVASVKAANLDFPERAIIRDGILKLRDPARQAVAAVTDINGEILSTSTNGLRGQLAMVWGSQISDLSFDVEDFKRFAAAGSPMDLTLKSKTMLLGFSGQGRADKGFQLVGQATTEAADIGGLFRWFGMPVQSLDGAGAVSLQSGIETNGLAVTLSTLAGDVGSTGLKGKVTLAAGADRAKISGDLTVSTLSLWGPKTLTTLVAQPWSEKPLAVSDVTAVDLDVTITTEQLKLRQRDFGVVTTQLKNSNGQMTLTIPEQKIAGGSGSAVVSFAKAGDRLKIEAATDLKSVSAQTILGGLLGFDFVDGAIDVNTKVKANGQSIADIVSSLEGDMKLVSQDSTFIAVDLITALTKPQKGWNVQESSKTEQTSFEIDVLLLEGVANLRSGSLAFNGVTLKPTGEVDLLRQAVAVQLAPKGKNTDAKMSMIGPWAAPTFSPVDILKENAAVTPPPN